MNPDTLAGSHERYAAPRTSPPRRIAVVGGGFCGAALAVHLTRRLHREAEVVLYDPATDVGRGVAFGTDRPEHRLNVPADAMSIDPAAPHDFIDFAASRGVALAPTDLAPRPLYGDYVHARYQEAVAARPQTVRHVRARATALAPVASGRWRVTASEGATEDVDEVVLATGHGPTKVPAPFADVAAHPALVADPWADVDAWARPVDGRVLLVGTGLSGIDVLASLREAGVSGPIHATSRGGHWPRAHLSGLRWPGPARVLDIERAPRTVHALQDWLEGHIAAAVRDGVPWQAVFDALRPHIASLWQRLPSAERTLFLTELRPQWEIHRHRTERAAAERIRAWREEGWLVTHAAGIGAVAARGDALEVTLSGRGGAWVGRFARVVLACGHESDPRRFRDPLWAQLLDEGWAVADRDGLGVLTDAAGALGARTRRPGGLWAVGGLLRPMWFDTTAVPDLSRQVVRLADVLAARAHAAVETVR